MNLIDCSYFYAGPLQVQNARPIDALDANALAVRESITAYIERYQGEYLEKMLGEELAQQVAEYLDDIVEGRMVQPEIDVIGGDDNASADMSDLCDRLRLSFAHYVYYKLVGDANQTMTITGLMKLKSANENQPIRNRMTRVWNEMVDLHLKFVKWADVSSYNVFYREEMVTYINQFNL